MSDFTKGPWRIVIKPTSSDNYFHLEGGCGHYDDKTDNGVFLDGFMCEEDAHLISAAPDMYEALKVAYEELKGIPDWPDLEEDHMADEQISKAIAKADGKSL